ncbi:MAG TPA: hypothetical protein VKD90_15155 [Gemmataceae bacterium]|nr:hypothetical protein [Gemmataceae bacterium]
MLWAQFQPKNEAEAAGFFVGVLMAGFISGAIPFVTGLLLKQTSLGVVGGIFSAGAGALAGCCLGFPVAIVFVIIIVVVSQNSEARRLPQVPTVEDGYDDYARPFQFPGAGEDPGRRRRSKRDDRDRDRDRRQDRERESDDEWRRRAEDEDHYRDRGFRPRRPGPD